MAAVSLFHSVVTSYECSDTERVLFLLGRKRNLLHLDSILRGKTLASAESASYLGVTLTKDLNWNEDVNHTADKANKILGFLRRNLKISSPVRKTLGYVLAWELGFPLLPSR